VAHPIDFRLSDFQPFDFQTFDFQTFDFSTFDFQTYILPDKQNPAFMTIGLIRERKSPPDTRVALTPDQCVEILRAHPSIEIVVEPSPTRSYKDTEYLEKGIKLSSDLADCSILVGIKEVPKESLLPNSTYLIFSHTHKRQAHNQKLLQKVLDTNIRLLDYELLTNLDGQRLIAFGYYAGVVGAHNGVWAYGLRTGTFSLPRMKDCHDYAEAAAAYSKIDWPPLQVVLTGTGRVAGGSRRTLLDMGFTELSPEAYLAAGKPTKPVFTQLTATDYVRLPDGQAFDKKLFYEHPEKFESAFAPFAAVSDIFVNGIFWNTKAPAFFNLEEMRDRELTGFDVIADVTCDIAPESSIPSTLRPSTIAEPLYGVWRDRVEETDAFNPNGITMMAVDNLPNELPRDASKFFGDQFIRYVLPELLAGPQSAVIRRATIAEKGQLTEYFKHLSDFVQEKEESPLT
jgi:saccharopine dehydrogenase (NAD+, L-lysine forming)